VPWQSLESKGPSKGQGISISKAIENFLLSCKVEGKSYGTIECYLDKLKGFLWYARNYNWLEYIVDKGSGATL